MKPVEEAFASAAFRRVVLPGIIITIGVHPILDPWMRIVQARYPVSPPILSLIEVIVLGLAVSSGLQWIYYIYEGFRLPRLTAVARWMNDRRVAKLQAEYRRLRNATAGAGSAVHSERIVRLYEFLNDFPTGTDQADPTAYHVERPTRLGNIIATYELYAETRFGIDGVHFWEHLLAFAPERMTREFDDRYAFAESLVLTSFSGALVSLLHAFVLVGLAVGAAIEPVLSVSTTPTMSTLLVAFGISTWFFFYKAALPAHRAAGAVLRACVDCSIPRFIEWSNSVPVPIPADTVSKVNALTNYLKLPNPSVVPPPPAVNRSSGLITFIRRVLQR